MAWWHYLETKTEWHNNILNLFNLSRNRKQSVVLNGQVPSLANVNTWVAISLLLSLIHINDLPDDIPNVKLSACGTSLFSVVHNVNTSAGEVSIDLVKINKWTYIAVEN